MKTKEILKKLEGTHNIESIMETLGVDRSKAVYYIYRLRKQGYIKTKRLSNNRRLYNISFENKLGGITYYEIINKYSPIKITSQEIYKIYGKVPSLEETLVYAVKTQKLRIILASLALFKKIDDWSELYRLAKANNIERQIGALYDLCRQIMRTRRMTKRFRNNALPKGKSLFGYVISGLKSKDFTKIEKIWRIYLPFNKSDLEDYL
jgi:DNA-binding Lrp family transcriptional regulator